MLSFISQRRAQLKNVHYLSATQRASRKIKPLLPLRLIKEGRNAIFPFDRYNDQIIDSKTPFPPIYIIQKKVVNRE
jgi:hypothetical protein